MVALSHQPIGVLDSGMGGLTVVKAIKHVLPQEDIIYIGDMARVPYGSKTPQTIQRYTLELTDFLIQQHVKCIVLACNTATTASLALLEERYPTLPIVGVIMPAIVHALSLSQQQAIAILATETTTKSHYYQRHIKQRAPSCNVLAIACNVLVALAEEAWVNTAMSTLTLSHYLAPLHTTSVRYDTLILGCTHFPVFQPEITRCVPNMHIINSANATANCLAQQLQQKDCLNTNANPGKCRFYVTDSYDRFLSHAALFLGEPIASDAIEQVSEHKLTRHDHNHFT